MQPCIRYWINFTAFSGLRVLSSFSDDEMHKFTGQLKTSTERLWSQYTFRRYLLLEVSLTSDRLHPMCNKYVYVRSRKEKNSYSRIITYPLMISPPVLIEGACNEWLCLLLWKHIQNNFYCLFFVLTFE